MTEPEFILEFRRSLLGVPAALNDYRAEHDVAPVESNRLLNFNAFDRAGHFMKAGMADLTAYEETVRPFDGQDVSDAVELVRQWPSVKEQPAEYLVPWIKDELARTVLLGEYGFVGIAGDVGLIDNQLKTIVVMVLTKNQPRR